MGVLGDKDYGVRREKTQDQVLRHSDICQVRRRWGDVSVQGMWWSSWSEDKRVMCYLETREECFKKEGEVNIVKCYCTGSNGMRMKVSVVLFGSRGKMEVVWGNGEEEIDIIYWDQPVTLVRSRKPNVQFRSGNCGQLFGVITLDTHSFHSDSLLPQEVSWFLNPKQKSHVLSHECTQWDRKFKIENGYQIWDTE